MLIVGQSNPISFLYNNNVHIVQLLLIVWFNPRPVGMLCVSQAFLATNCGRRSSDSSRTLSWKFGSQRATSFWFYQNFSLSSLSIILKIQTCFLNRRDSNVLELIISFHKNQKVQWDSIKLNCVWFSTEIENVFGFILNIKVALSITGAFKILAFDKLV